MSTIPPTPPGDPGAASIAELVSRVSEQLSTLVRDEIRLAEAELKEKGRRAGLGAGLFGGAGLVAWFGVGALVAAAILGLANAVAPWLAAVIVGVVLLMIAGIAAVLGKKEITQATPPVPEQAVSSIREDVNVVKNSVRR
jgi:uncharacterized membrane protein YqjE